jgi:hypothetical protein
MAELFFGFEVAIQEVLDPRKHQHTIFFHDDGVSAFANLQHDFVWRIL